MSTESVSSPYLSFVVVSRNDDHGGNLHKRMQLFVSGLLEQCRRYAVKSELIVVEWNAPEDRPGLAEALYWPDTDGYCTVRIIHVPPEVHRRFKFADALPVFQMIGKNVGIRRTRGEFVLATNVDILFSHDLFNLFSSARFETGKIYRMDRHDVCEDISQEMTLDEQLAYCENHLIRVNRRDGTFDLSPTGEILNNDDGLNNWRAAPPAKRLWLLTKLSWPLLRRKAGELVLDSYRRRHTNASGDFMLMSRDDWFALRGYCEYEMYSMHLDSLLCQSARTMGIQEVILESPNRIYHIEHSPGSGFQPGKGGELLYQRLREAGIPAWTDYQLMRRVFWMWLQRNPILYNPNPEWGLADEFFTETCVSSFEKEGKIGQRIEESKTLCDH